MAHADELTGKTVLVTGASGFLGSRTVALLAKHGCHVRALVRKTSRTDHLRLPNVSITFGDVTKAESLPPAFEEVDFVIHAAADTSGGEEKENPTTVKGTKNILDLCERFNVRKLIYISSCSVYGVVDYRQGEVVTEESTLERFPEKRGPTPIPSL